MYCTTYEAAVAAARIKAKETGRDYGLEKWSSPLTPGKSFRVFMLPDEKNQQGFELRCEVVRPTDPA